VQYKISKYSHPDLHFIYPTVTTDVKTKPKSIDFIADWRQFITQKSIRRPEWYDVVECHQKFVDDASTKTLSLNRRQVIQRLFGFDK
jgi:hypothetical protein